MAPTVAVSVNHRSEQQTTTEKGERRKVPRFAVQLAGTVTFNSEGHEIESKVSTRNISAYGAYLLTDARPPLGGRVKLRLLEGFSDADQSGGKFETVGTILRIDQLSNPTYGVAVKFENVPGFG